MLQKILDALNKLETANDNHWTDDGLPRVETMRLLVGNPKLTREEIINAAPNFTRANAAAEAAKTTQAPATPAQAAQAVPVQGSTTGGKITAPAAPQPPAAPVIVQAVSDEKGFDLETELAAERAVLEEMHKARAALDSNLKAQRDKVDALIIKTEGVREAGHIENMKGIRAYLDAQKKLGEQRAEQLRELRESGIDIKKLQDALPKAAPIDAARANRRRV